MSEQASHVTGTISERGQPSLEHLNLFSGVRPVPSSVTGSGAVHP